MPYNEIKQECKSAMSKYPSFHSTHEGYAVIAEEVDELWKLVKKNKGMIGTPEMKAECIQIAAMAIRFIADLCENKNQEDK